jgi:hypothetical protein
MRLLLYNKRFNCSPSPSLFQSLPHLRRKKSGCIHISEKDSLGTRQSTYVHNIYSANILSGSQTAMPLSSSCPMRVAILQFCVCRCALCIGMWTLCIGRTQSLVMPTTGHIWALTLTLTHFFASTLSLLVNFGSHTQPTQIFPCNPRTCHTITGHVFKSQLPTRTQLAHCTFKAC